MMDQRAAGRYARALLGLALERNELDTIDEALTQLRLLIDQHPRMVHVLLNSTIQEADKEAFLDRILAGTNSGLLSNFLKLLVKKRRFQEFSAIQEKFHQLVKRQKGVLEVTAISAAPLAQGTQTRLVETLKKKLKADIYLTSEVDENIIGGLIIRFEGREIDTSFKSRLKALRQRLVAVA